MNKVIVNINKFPYQYAQGSVFIDDKTGEFYLLSAIVGGDHEIKYVAISFKSGNNWSLPHENIKDAILGLKFISDNCKITIDKI